MPFHDNKKPMQTVNKCITVSYAYFTNKVLEEEKLQGIHTEVDLSLKEL